jgi:hypothetical protein
MSPKFVSDPSTLAGMSGPRTELLQTATQARLAKAPRGGSRRNGDWWQRFGIVSAFNGTNGKVYLIGLLALGIFVACVDTVSVWNDLHFRPDFGLLAPVVWELTSAVGFLAFSAIAWVALQVAPLEQPPWWRTVLIHAGAIPLYCLLHVGTFVLLRKALYALAGYHYTYGPLKSEIGFEFFKDIFAYLLMVTIYWVVARVMREPAVPVETDGIFAIRDGARIVRVKMSDILAVSSAGNYVEFTLRDGRKPLMRTPLSAIEAQLSSRGFVRVHRSWLVNAGEMTGLKPRGSGDYELELGEVMVPVSRRFPDALARLKAS